MNAQHEGAPSAMAGGVVRRNGAMGGHADDCASAASCPIVSGASACGRSGVAAFFESSFCCSSARSATCECAIESGWRQNPATLLCNVQPEHIVNTMGNGGEADPRPVC